MLLLTLSLSVLAPTTTVAIDGTRWLVNGAPTHPGTPAEGLLLNVRMVNATYEDARPESTFDADANVDRFLARLDDYQGAGVDAFTFNLQGGGPSRDTAHRRAVVNSAFNTDGSLKPAYLARVERVLRACDERGMVVILGLFYEAQSARLADEDAVRAGVVAAVTWLRETGLRNVVLEIANEYDHPGFVHPIIRRPSGMVELIELARATWPELLISASGLGHGRVAPEVVAAGDFVLPHFNGTDVAGIPARLAALTASGKPVVCNEDDKSGANAVAALRACVAAGAGYGLMLNDLNQYLPFEWHGPADDPEFYAALAEVSGAPDAAYYPPPESQGGWRQLTDPDDLRTLAGLDPDALAALADWLRASDDRPFAASLVRRGYLCLEVERGRDAATSHEWVKSVSKAICATALAIALERGRAGLGPVELGLDEPCLHLLPAAAPLSDPRKAQITARQLLDHTSGICPESTGVNNYIDWPSTLGHGGDPRTALLAFDPGTGCGYSTLAYQHAALLVEALSGQDYEAFLREHLLAPLGIEQAWFGTLDGEPLGTHASGALGLSARDLARIGWCLAQGGRWAGRQVVPRWYVLASGQPSSTVTTPELRWGLSPRYFALGWELPANLDGASGREGHGIPAELRAKFGSGGQSLAWVPADAGSPARGLVVTRQTGGAGEWAYEEYLRRAVAAVVD